ncbi:ACT domain-containing protein ACR9 [Linum perenne]
MQSGGGDDAVLIEKGRKPGDPRVVTVNCPDKTGLACDICRIILDFGLFITKGDVSTDGNWCYIVFWVVPNSGLVVRWMSLKNRLLSACPSCSVSFVLPQYLMQSTSSPVYLLKFFSLDRKGLLHDVTQVLSELEFAIQRVKVTTTPDGRVMDLFFITDNMELLHTKKRQDETREQFHAVLGESCISCELDLAGTEYECLQGRASLCPAIADELFHCEITERETRSQALSPDLIDLKKANVTVDNSLSPVHTLLQIHCLNHKGLLYDVMRTLKDCNIQLEMLHPLRVIITSRGPDTELLVANPVELSGNGRPMVFYDVTLALKSLEICIFSAEISRHSAGGREWEVYRFLLDDNCRYRVSSEVARDQIVDRVRRALMGW